MCVVVRNYKYQDDIQYVCLPIFKCLLLLLYTCTFSGAKTFRLLRAKTTRLIKIPFLSRSNTVQIMVKRKFENIVGKVEIADYEQFHFLPQCFQMSSLCGKRLTSKDTGLNIPIRQHHLNTDQHF